MGGKIANCVALFSMEQLDTFPVDIRVSRSLGRHYRDLPKTAQGMCRWAQHRFGRYPGYAEAVLFFDDFSRTTEGHPPPAT